MSLAGTPSYGYGDFSAFGVTPPTDVAATAANQATDFTAPTLGAPTSAGMTDKQRQMLAASLMGMGQQKQQQGQAQLNALASQQIGPVNGIGSGL